MTRPVRGLRRFLPRTLTTKLSLFAVCILFVVLLCFSVYDLLQMRHSLHVRLEESVDLMTSRLSKALRYPVWNLDWESAEDVMRSEMPASSVQCLILTDDIEGEVVRLVRRSGEALVNEPCEPADTDIVRQTSVVSMGGNEIGRLTVVAGSRHIQQELLGHTVRSLAEVVFVMLVLVFALFVFARRTLLNPITSLTSTTLTVAENQDYSVRAWLRTNDEIEVLAANFNHMLDEIEARERRLRSYNKELEDVVASRTVELERKALELEQANVKLVWMDELKSSFLSTVSHDLRTPLTSVLGFSKIIDRDFTKHFVGFAENDTKLARISERIKENLLIIHNEGERLIRLINDFLDLSKIESGRLEWRDQAVDVRSLARQAIDAMQGRFDELVEVDLLFSADENLPEAFCDPDRLLQVLANLLSNAAKFTRRGHVQVLVRNDNGCLRIEVHDTGSGIPADQLQNIFDKFHKVPEHDTLDEKPPEGTGLGLAICNEIVQHYKGRIWVESEPGKGSTFIVEMPVFRASDSPLPEERAAFPGPTVLVVAVGNSKRRSMRQILEGAGHAVFEAEDGHGALESARTEEPGLIVLDSQMPGMTGEQVVEALQGDPRSKKIPVLTVSIQDLGRDAATGQGSGKSVTPQDMLGAVAFLLRGTGRCLETRAGHSAEGVAVRAELVCQAEVLQRMEAGLDQFLVVSVRGVYKRSMKDVTGKPVRHMLLVS
jgi:signal transduction histidine kinase/DNA-binding response OmpR family regulator